MILHSGSSSFSEFPVEIQPKQVAKNEGGKIFGKKSHIDFALQTRHIDTAGKRTTIALERAFWRQADSQAEKVGLSWQRWAEGMLEDRPENIGKARWLRVRLLMVDGQPAGGGGSILGAKSLKTVR